MQDILDWLSANQHRSSSKSNYLSIWRHFNNFLIKLDKMPKNWEMHTSLFCAHLVEQGIKSTTLRSYISAIKQTLSIIKYNWDNSLIMVNSITRACKLHNDTMITRFPINIGLLETLLFELDRFYSHSQPYLNIMFRALFLVAYYGLMRIGELALGDHSIKAKDIHIGCNKNKILLVLYSSKTHGKESNPQQIKISLIQMAGAIPRHYCPFTAITEYMGIRGKYLSDSENLFILTDRSPVKPDTVCHLLCQLLSKIGLNPALYNCQSFRISRASDLVKFGINIETIKHLGCRKSNAVYRYLKY